MLGFLIDFFNLAFFQQLITTVAGVIIGIPAGLWLQGLISARGFEQQNRQLRQALKANVQHNVGTLATIKEFFAEGKPLAIPTFNVDVALLDATAHAKYAVLGDFDLCGKIDHLRTELSHLERQIDALFNLILDPMASESSTTAKGERTLFLHRLAAVLIEAINMRLPPLEKECADILQRLNATEVPRP